MIDPNPAYALGLEQGVNRLVEYNPLWPIAFSEEAARIRVGLGGKVLAIEHYGSTSVPELRAKPIIDFLIGVADINDGLGFIEPMAGLGYDYAGGQGIPEHHIFGRGKARTFLAHVVVFEGQQWIRSLGFRDRLRNDVDVRTAYEALKVKLAATALNRADYTAKKAGFIDGILQPLH